LTPCISAAQSAFAKTALVAAASEVQLGESASTLMFDYQVLKTDGNETLDLLGYHWMAPVNNWLSFGLTSYALV
jgi:hypothetical protein